MVVKHNITAMNSNRMFNLTNKSQAKSTEKLSSGYKIRRRGWIVYIRKNAPSDQRTHTGIVQCVRRYFLCADG